MLALAVAAMTTRVAEVPGLHLLAVSAPVFQMQAGTPAPSDAPWRAWAAVLVTVLFLALLLVLVIGAGLKFFDLAGRREAEAEHLEDRITAALYRSFGDISVRPLADVPTSKGSGVIVEIHGPLRSVELKEAVLRVAQQELTRIRSDGRVEDRVAVVDEAASRHVA